jgi:hypothetical protein
MDDGNYLFFYNSAEVGWPDNYNASHHPGWVILDGKDPSKILARA